ncbi:MAG TPA: monovalent cation/H(+) antiporter subunit G [Trueperaceae bacterium]|nr:monovalent cation/H(+) antiporter subunit G [Trueperaceae bacterium]
MEVPELQPVAAFAVGLLVLFGALVSLIGTVGLVRLKTFYDRVHAPTLGLTLGNACILIGSIVCFTALGTRAVVHEILVLVFVILTTPVTMMLLAGAALFRDRSKAFDQRLAAEVLAAAKQEAAELQAAQEEAALHQRAMNYDATE